MDTVDLICGSLMALLLAAIATYVGVAIHKSRSPTFTLYKENWECTETHLETYPMTTFVGNVPVTSYATSEVCDNWKRRK